MNLTIDRTRVKNERHYLLQSGAKYDAAGKVWHLNTDGLSKDIIKHLIDTGVIDQSDIYGSEPVKGLEKTEDVPVLLEEMEKETEFSPVTKEEKKELPPSWIRDVEIDYSSKIGVLYALTKWPFKMLSEEDKSHVLKKMAEDTKDNDIDILFDDFSRIAVLSDLYDRAFYQEKAKKIFYSDRPEEEIKILSPLEQDIYRFEYGKVHKTSL